MAFERVAKASEVPDGSGLRVRVGERELGIFRVGDDYYAIDNACPHAGYPLSEGLLEGHTVICTAHGWEFDVRTGLGAGANFMTTPLGCYRIQREGEDLLIEVPER